MSSRYLRRPLLRRVLECKGPEAKVNRLFVLVLIPTQADVGSLTILGSVFDVPSELCRRRRRGDGVISVSGRRIQNRVTSLRMTREEVGT